MHNITELTEYKKELRGKLLATAMAEFASRGIKAVKMDDIAAKLGISKRTMYEIYSTKEDILLEGILKHDEKEERQFAEYIAMEPRTTMDIMIEFFRMQMKAASSVCPQFYSDLHKYQNVLKALAKKHSERDKRALDFFKKGIDEGYFRSDFDYTLLLTVVRQSMQYVMDNQLYKQYGTQRLFRNMIMLFIRGFATQKGIQEFDKALEEYK
jgi:AcrR family transcriptional regulator